MMLNLPIINVRLNSRPEDQPQRRRFLVALALVCGLGLSCGEAWAQAWPGSTVTSTRKPGKKSTQAVAKRTRKPGIQNQVISKMIVACDLSDGTTAADSGVSGPEPRIYLYVEQMPEYKDGGYDGMMRMLARNRRWPASAAGVAGQVFVDFIVSKTGRVYGVKINRGLHPAMDAEALRVVRLLDNQFVPGQRNGQPVEVLHTVPISFERK